MQCFWQVKSQAILSDSLGLRLEQLLAQWKLLSLLATLMRCRPCGRVKNVHCAPGFTQGCSLGRITFKFHHAFDKPACWKVPSSVHNGTRNRHWIALSRGRDDLSIWHSRIFLLCLCSSRIIVISGRSIIVNSGRERVVTAEQRLRNVKHRLDLFGNQKREEFSILFLKVLCLFPTTSLARLAKSFFVSDF